jgi:hypothetical protein
LSKNATSDGRPLDMIDKVMPLKTKLDKIEDV